MKNFSIIQPDDQVPNYAAFIKDALTEGFEQYQAYLENPKLFPTSGASHFYHAFAQLQDDIMQQRLLVKPSSFQTQQSCLFSIIYNPHNKFTIADKLFLEFLIGLARFALALTLSSLYFGSLQANLSFEFPKNTQCFWDFFHELAILNEKLINKIAKKTNNFSTMDFWQSAHEFFKTHPKLEKLARMLTAIHYVPSSNEDKKIMSLAQMLHWSGFGGSGEFIEHISLLQPLLSYCCAYHKRHIGGFNQRFSIILQLHDSAERYALPLVTSLLCEQYPAESTIDILDVGSGPQFLAVTDIIEKMLAAQRKISLTVSEVDMQSINSLLELQKSTDFLHEVRLLDLNLIDEINTNEKNIYDVVTARLVLHQLAAEDITKAFRLFIQLIRPHGFIINGDVSTANYFQTLLVPSNLVDRESYVPHWKNFNFIETAVKINESMSKIAIPLAYVDKNFPSDEIPMRNFMVYQIYCIPSNTIENLQELWLATNYQQALEQCKRLAMS